MFCPACGSNNSDEQRFCRRCGMNLEATAQSLRDWVPSAESADLIRREQRLERFGRIAFGGFGLIVMLAVIGLIYTIATKMVLSGSEPWVDVLLIAFITFAALTLTYVVFNEDLKARRRRARPAPPTALEGSVVTGKLLEETQFEPISTVTDNTTELLPTRKREL